MHTARTKLQRDHRRCPELPACFAEATLASATREARTPAQEAARAKAQRQALRLVDRGELSTEAVK
jgi:hypothetical protein